MLLQGKNAKSCDCISMREQKGRSGRSGLVRSDALCPHVRLECFGDEHGSVRLLVVFDDGHPGPTDGEGASVYGVDEVGLRLSSFKPDLGAPCLEGLKVGTGGYLFKCILARQPDFDVVGLGGTETCVSSA